MKNKNYVIPKNTDMELKNYLSHLTNTDSKGGLILTDNYAPAENMYIR